MRLPLEAVAEDAYAVPQCQALARGEYSWVSLHQCPWRGRYRIVGTFLCGQHLRAHSVTLIGDDPVDDRSRPALVHVLDGDRADGAVPGRHRRLGSATVTA